MMRRLYICSISPSSGQSLQGSRFYASLAPTTYEGPKDSARNPDNWTTVDGGSLMYYANILGYVCHGFYFKSPNSKPSTKIAAFGFNKCLVTTSVFRRGPDAWALRYQDVPKKLKELHEAGYKLVIFSNHSPIGTAKADESKNRAIVQQVGRTGGFIESVGLPFQIFVSTGPAPKKAKATPADPYRKPSRAMWDFMVKSVNGGVTPQLDKCFFVGGAAGRPEEDGRRADHSDYDILFAKNVGVQFILDETYFDPKGKLPGPKMAPRPKKEKPEVEGVAAEDSGLGNKSL